MGASVIYGFGYDPLPGCGSGATRTMEDPGGGLCISSMALLWDFTKVWEDMGSAGVVAVRGGLLSPRCESVGEAHDLMNKL